MKILAKILILLLSLISALGYANPAGQAGKELHLGSLTLGAGFYNYKYDAVFSRFASNQDLKGMNYRIKYTFHRGSFIEAKNFTSDQPAFKYSGSSVHAQFNLSRSWGLGYYYKLTKCTAIDMVIYQPYVNYFILNRGQNNLWLGLNYEEVKNRVPRINVSYLSKGLGGSLGGNWQLAGNLSVFANYFWFPELSAGGGITLKHTQYNAGLTYRLSPRFSTQLAFHNDDIDGTANLPLKVQVDGWGLNLLYKF